MSKAFITENTIIVKSLSSFQSFQPEKRKFLIFIDDEKTNERTILDVINRNKLLLLSLFPRLSVTPINIIAGEIAILIYFMYKKGNINNIFNLSEEIKNFANKNNPIFVSNRLKEDISKMTNLEFHPDIDTDIYVKNPVNDNIYYALEVFHKDLMEHKFWEAIELLRNLGAREVVVKYVNNEKNKISSAVGGTVKTVEGKLGGEVVIDRDTTRDKDIYWQAKYKNPKQIDPTIKDKLFWFKHEIGWQKIYQDCVVGSLEEVNLSIKYLNDYGINLNLKMLLEKIGFNFKYEFNDFKAIEFLVNAKF